LKYDYVDTITIKAHSADSYGAASTIRTISSFTSKTLTGSYAEDYIENFTTSSSYRYWWVNYNATSASKVQHSKLFFGAAVDPGADPDTFSYQRLTNSQYQRKPFYRYTIGWKKLPYATAMSLMTRFGKPREYNGVVMFTTSDHTLLNNNTSVYGRVLSFSAPLVETGYNDVSMVVEEIV